MGMHIICGKPGAGKTLLLAHILNLSLYDYDRISAMQYELSVMNKNGFNLTIPQHCTSSGGFDVFGWKFRASERVTRRINPYYLGFKENEAEDKPLHFSLPFEVVGITEAKKYFISRMSLYYPDWQSRYFEGHRHQGLEFYFDCQRADLVDLNLRSLCDFWEVQGCSVKTNRFNEVTHCEWYVREFLDIKSYDAYFNVGGKDRSFYSDKIIKADYNVYRLYDTHCLKPKFYQGNFYKDADLIYGKPTDANLDSYVKFIKQFNDELPDWFYKKRKVA